MLPHANFVVQIKRIDGTGGFNALLFGVIGELMNEVHIVIAVETAREAV
jgi:hypothetical protein